MAAQHRVFSATLREPTGTAVIDLHGEINAAAEAELMDAYHQAVEHDARAILLNFSDVDYINSTGIALIVTLLAQARAARRKLLTCGLSEHYREIFHITRLSDFMQVFDDESAALAEAHQPATHQS